MQKTLNMEYLAMAMAPEVLKKRHGMAFLLYSTCCIATNNCNFKVSVSKTPKLLSPSSLLARGPTAVVSR